MSLFIGPFTPVQISSMPSSQKSVAKPELNFSFYKTLILYSDLFPHSTSCTWPLPLALLSGTWFRVSQENHIGGNFLLKLLGVSPWKDIFHYILPGQVRLGHGRGQEEQAQGQDEVHSSANSNLSTSTH